MLPGNIFVKQKGKFMQLKRNAEGMNGRETVKVNCQNQIEYLTFPALEELGIVRHLFSTRYGGVSEGVYASMNLSYTRGDKKENVDENYKRIAGILKSSSDKIVCSSQTHTTNVRLVTERDCGKGIVHKLDYDNVDGLVTNIPGIVLCTLYADCVPLYFVDPKNRAIGLGHSGWRGTVGRMGEAMLLAMKNAFGTRTEDVIAAIGPSICQDCYEVDEDVADKFKHGFPEEWKFLLKDGKASGKFQLNLWEANRRVLIKAGIRKNNISVTDVCTCCNSEVLFSHRASGGKRGNLGAFLTLIPEE